MHQLVSAVCLLAWCGLTLAWYTDNAVYGGWTPNRRSMVKRCAGTGDACKKSYNCCKVTDMCFVPYAAYGRLGTCQPLFDDPKKTQFHKKPDEDCVDSYECEDQCCRPIRIGKMGFRHKCGKPGEYSCVGLHTNPNIISKNNYYQ